HVIITPVQAACRTLFLPPQHLCSCHTTHTLLLAMNNLQTPGLCLLALDGGGIRGLSMLIILKHLMYKLKVAEDLPTIPHPCDYF
ncbi:hypothetical protein B0H14DRAFT_2870134, partial [Mycena olivaceomarginata]